MKIVTIVMHKILPENAWEQRILTQLGFPQVKKTFRRPAFLVKDSELKRLLRVLSKQNGLTPTKNIVKEFQSGNNVEGTISSKQAVKLCT